MNTKNVTIFKYITIASFAIMSLISCETDFENVGGNLVDNDVFDTSKKSFEVLAYSKDIESSRVDNISTQALTTLKMPLGVYDTEDFGLFKSSVIAQINVPSATDEWSGSIINAVYLEIPYDAESIREATDDKPKFKLNNVFGDNTQSFNITISRLETYLNKLDPTDPSKPNKYYSDKVYNTSNILASNVSFKPNSNDTILKYDRLLIDLNNIVVEDTIKLGDTKPFIRIPLNKTFFQNNFINNTNETIFESNSDFHEFFKGIEIKATGTDGTVLMLDYNTAKINMYVSLSETEEKSETDLNVDFNNDGDTDDSDVVKDVRKKKVYTFPLTGIKTNQFIRDNTMSNAYNKLTNADQINGEDKLYVQGAQGSIAVLDLFKDIDLTELRNKNWLINEANLTFYIDNANDNDVPNRLLLYKLDTDDANNINENYQILDAITENNTFNGFLVKDGDSTDDDEDRNPIKYKINITDYISEVLKKENFTAPSKLGLKVYNGLDTPISAQDTIVKDYSWNPQGVVLYGNNYSETHADYNKRIKLEVYYTELNN